MDKYEYKVRADEIRRLVSEGDYAGAMEVCDTIDWNRVKSVMMLCTVSDIYKINRRYEDSKNILLLAYDRHPGGRQIVYSLCELSIKLEEYIQAIEYYKEFMQIAPRDSGKYVLYYKLLEAQDAGIEERIEVLQKLKQRDYKEKWAYELAYLYHRNGNVTACIEECDELILWFGEGKYVMKAMELKMLHTALTPDQQAKYDLWMGKTSPQKFPDTDTFTRVMDRPADEAYLQQTQEVEQPQPENENTPNSDTKELDIHVKTMDVGQYNTINLQKALAESMKEVLDTGNTVQEQPQQFGFAQPVQQEQPQQFSFTQPVQQEEPALTETVEPFDQTDPTPSVEAEIPYDSSRRRVDPDAEEIFFEDKTGTIDPIPELPREPETKLSAADLVMQAMKRDWTGEIPAEEINKAAEPKQTVVETPQPVQREVEQPQPVPVQPKVKQPQPVQEQPVQPEVASVPTPQPHPVTPNVVLPAQPAPSPIMPQKSKFDKILSQEYDGQISLVVPDSEKIEKQITGQMSIEDIMAEWERMKKENEKKRAEDVRRHVLEQTGNLFKDFDISSKSGLLEQLDGEIGTSSVVLPGTKELPSELEDLQDIDEDEEQTGEDEETEEIPEIEELSESEGTDLEEVEDIEDVDDITTEEESEPELESDLEEVEDIEENAEEELETELPQEDTGESEELPETEETEEPTEIVEIEENAEEPTEEPEEEEPEETMDENADVEDSAGEEEPEEETDADESGEEPEEPQNEARALTPEERDLFGQFIQSKHSRRQIVQALDNISLAAYTGNIIVTGDAGAGTMTLAKNLIREVQMTDHNFSGRVAKITASALNKKDIPATLAKLSNGALIIQSAGNLNQETTKALYKTLNNENQGIIVVLEGTKKSIDRMLEDNQNLLERFNARVDVEALGDEALASFGRKYAHQMEYSIDEMGMLALHTRISEMQTIDHAVTIYDVRDIVDEAIERADRKNIKHFFDILFGKRYDNDDMIILREHDFIA